MISEWDKLVANTKNEVTSLLDRRFKGSNGTNQKVGHLVAIRLAILLDGEGNPIVWTIDEPIHVKPGQRAKALLDLL